MLNHAIKATKDQIVKHIKKIAAQPKTQTSGKPEAKGPGTLGGCIPVGD